MCMHAWGAGVLEAARPGRDGHVRLDELKAPGVERPAGRGQQRGHDARGVSEALRVQLRGGDAAVRQLVVHLQLQRAEGRARAEPNARVGRERVRPQRPLVVRPHHRVARAALAHVVVQALAVGRLDGAAVANEQVHVVHEALVGARRHVRRQLHELQGHAAVRQVHHVREAPGVKVRRAELAVAHVEEHPALVVRAPAGRLAQDRKARAAQMQRDWLRWRERRRQPRRRGHRWRWQRWR